MFTFSKPEVLLWNNQADLMGFCSQPFPKLSLMISGPEAMRFLPQILFNTQDNPSCTVCRML